MNKMKDVGMIVLGVLLALYCVGFFYLNSRMNRADAAISQIVGFINQSQQKPKE